MHCRQVSSSRELDGSGCSGDPRQHAAMHAGLAGSGSTCRAATPVPVCPFQMLCSVIRDVFRSLKLSSGRHMAPPQSAGAQSMSGFCIREARANAPKPKRFTNLPKQPVHGLQHRAHEVTPLGDKAKHHPERLLPEQVLCSGSDQLTLTPHLPRTSLQYPRREHKAGVQNRP